MRLLEKFNKINIRKIWSKFIEFILLEIKRVRLYSKNKLKYIFSFIKLLYWFLFASSVFLLLIVLGTMMPNNVPILGEVRERMDLPTIYEIHGNVQTMSNIRSQSKNESVSGIRIEVGGYSCKVNASGEYKLRFSSRSSENIPVIIKLHSKIPDSQAIIERVTFDDDSFSKEEDFIIDFK